MDEKPPVGAPSPTFLMDLCLSDDVYDPSILDPTLPSFPSHVLLRPLIVEVGDIRLWVYDHPMPSDLPPDPNAIMDWFLFSNVSFGSAARSSLLLSSVRKGNGSCGHQFLRLLLPP